MTSLPALLEDRARLGGSQAYLEDARSTRRLDYRSLSRATTRWLTLLDERSVAPGEPVLLDIEDPLAFAVAYLAVIAAGRCAVPVDPGAPAAELDRIVRATNPVLALSDRPQRTGISTVPVDPVTGEPPAGAAAAARRGATATNRSGSVRLCTSGSTGEPKIVELDERLLLHVAGAVAAHNELTPQDRGYNPLPLFHINAQVVGLLATLVAGATLVLDRRFHRRGFWQRLRERDVTWCNAVPAILTILADEPAPPELPALRFIRSASAPLPPVVRRRLSGMLPVPVVESYGMTEAASQITAAPLDGSAPAGSAGRPVRVDLQVRRCDGSPARPGEVGRIWIRGAGVIRGYFGGRAPERFDESGWLDTGDLGSVDRKGFLYHSGRADEVINRGGEMVYPREVEEALLGHRAVQEAVVLGAPHPVLGAVPVAYLLTVPCDQDALAAELRALCAAQLSRHKHPTAFHFVPEFPRAATGKIRRRALVGALS